MKKYLFRQFGNPSGLPGAIAGWLMAVKNRKRIAWAVALMCVRPDEEILEIGFGPGLAIKMIASQLKTGKIIGYDRSPVMVSQAKKRNQNVLKTGRALLFTGNHRNINPQRVSFDKVLVINVHWFWRDPIGELKIIKSLLKPNGFLLLVFQPPFMKTEREIQKMEKGIVANIRESGFKKVELISNSSLKRPCMAFKAFNQNP